MPCRWTNFAESSKQKFEQSRFRHHGTEPFARAGRMDELQIVVGDDEPVLLGEVAAELVRGIPGYPSLGSVAAAAWLKQVELQELPELAAFARYKGELGGGPERNNGEAAVLAWASINGGIAIIDEVVARAIGNREGLQVHGSLWLLIRSFRTRMLDSATVEAIVDDLIGSGMRLPVSTGATFSPGPTRLESSRSAKPCVATPWRDSADAALTPSVEQLP
jgi:predicted nucleic acid-binding protein